MSLLKKLDKAAMEGPQLEKPEYVVISDGDMSDLEETLGRIKARGGEFNAVLAILPLSADMPTEKRHRTRQIKDDNGEPTGTETYLSSIQYADSRRVMLPFEITPGNQLFASFKFLEVPAEAAEVEKETAEENEE